MRICSAWEKLPRWRTGKLAVRSFILTAVGSNKIAVSTAAPLPGEVKTGRARRNSNVEVKIKGKGGGQDCPSYTSREAGNPFKSKWGLSGSLMGRVGRRFRPYREMN